MLKEEKGEYENQDLSPFAIISGALFTLYNPVKKTKYVMKYYRDAIVRIIKHNLHKSR